MTNFPLLLVLLLSHIIHGRAFTCRPTSFSRPSSLALYGRSSASLSGQSGGKSKRQHRVAQLVQGEIASILFSDYEVKTSSPLPANLRSHISILSCDVSPDLRQARLSVSVLSSSEVGEVEKRRAFSWLVSNSPQIRHALAQRLKHMKSVPSLTFALTDVGVAVDVMALIDKAAKGEKRDYVGTFGGDGDALPEGWVLEDDEEDDVYLDDEDDEDDEGDDDDDLLDFEWDDEDDEEER